MAATTLTDRAVVRLSGEDAREFLQGLVTSDVASDFPVWAGLLTPQGKCLFDFIVWTEGEDLLLDCETNAADDLIKRLSIYRLRRPIRIARDSSLAVHWSLSGEKGTADPRLADAPGARASQMPSTPASDMAPKAQKPDVGSVTRRPVATESAAPSARWPARTIRDGAYPRHPP